MFIYRIVNKCQTHMYFLRESTIKLLMMLFVFNITGMADTIVYLTDYKINCTHLYVNMNNMTRISLFMIFVKSLSAEILKN